MQIIASLILLVFLASVPNAHAFAKRPKAAVPAEAASKKYCCPMQCQILDKPGKCPKCGMEMWEVSAS